MAPDVDFRVVLDASSTGFAPYGVYIVVGTSVEFRAVVLASDESVSLVLRGFHFRRASSCYSAMDHHRCIRGSLDLDLSKRDQGPGVFFFNVNVALPTLAIDHELLSGSTALSKSSWSPNLFFFALQAT